MRGGENEPSEHNNFRASRKFTSLASSDVKIFFAILNVSFHRNEKNGPFKGNLHF